MSSNFAVRAILALPGISERELRVLMVLETVTADKDGWREIGTELLARYARISVKTAARARARLVALDLIEYVRGDGRRLSAYRFRIPASAAEGVRQAAAEEARRAKRHEGGPNADHPVRPAEGGQVASGGWSDAPREGGHRIPATSDDATGVLYPSVLKDLVPRAPARAPARAREASADRDRPADPGAGEDRQRSAIPNPVDGAHRPQPRRRKTEPTPIGATGPPPARSRAAEQADADRQREAFAAAMRDHPEWTPGAGP